MCNFGRGLAKKHFCEIISKSVHRFSRRSCLELFFLFIALVAFCSTERNGLSNFGGQSPNYFKIDALVKEEKSFKGYSIFSSGGHLVQ